MCRMAIVFSDNKPLKDFEMAFKTAWGRSNDDGVGVYWRDYPVVKATTTRHLARFVETKKLVRIPTTYDRMFIHFRNATGGDGTHPFSCVHVPENGSGNWFMSHNGCVQHDEARKNLKAKHKFSTEIDSEVMAHIWGEVDHKKPMPEQVKDFIVKINEHKVTGWANLIFYNVVTDDWVVFCDGAIKMVAIEGILVICSDTEWLDDSQTKKLDVKSVSVDDGNVVYGKGTQIAEQLKEVWRKKPTYSNTYNNNNYGGHSGQGNGRIYNVGSTYDSQARQRALQSSIDKGGEIYVANLMERCSDHIYIPNFKTRGEDDEPVCQVCTEDKVYHNFRGDSDDDEDDDRDSKPIDAKWRKRHEFERDDEAKSIACKCGSASGFGTYHAAHTFLEVKPDNPYCKACGRERTVGNHKELTADNHFFVPMHVASTKMGDPTYIKWLESALCNRCAKTKAEHTQNQELEAKFPSATSNPFIPMLCGATTIITEGNVTKTVSKPKDCECELKAKPRALICRPHWDMGFRFVDGDNIIRKTRKDGSFMSENNVWMNFRIVSEEDGLEGRFE